MCFSFRGVIEVLLDHMLGTALCLDAKDQMFIFCQFSSYIYCLKALTLLWRTAFVCFLCTVLHFSFLHK